ncbi:MAG TPA: dihydrodipicolinate synthase family protein [Bryobacteraceae bacterium]
MSRTIKLPDERGAFSEYTLTAEEPLPARPGTRFESRIAYAAAHVVTNDDAEPAIDMAATLAYRRYLWSLGFGIAEVMDTAQRGMGLDWSAAKDLIRASCTEARAGSRPIFCGANTDQLPAGMATLDQVLAAYEEQCAFIEAAGGRIILMASRALAQCAQNADDYRSVYRHLLAQVSQPIILHWLGEAFDPALRGYWGSSDIAVCMETCLDLIHAHRQAIDGIKISLLDKDREIEMRRRLPAGVRMYTGDDFHYPELIEGDEHGYSDALLGIFDGIAPAAAAAFQRLDANDSAGYRSLLLPTLPLSRHIFQKPTYHYKTGLAFLSYLNGRQQHFRMLGNQQTARSIEHLAGVFRLADQARLLSDPDLAIARMRSYLERC